MTTTRLHVILAGAAAVSALALFSGAGPGDTGTALASGSAAGIAAVPIDDTDFVNDDGQTSGDIFTQNAQDQSTA